MSSIRLLLVGIFVLMAGDAAIAQDVSNYPSKPVSVVIPLSSGGVVDIEARLLTNKLQASLGQPFVLDFRPGAGQTIGISHTLKSPPDGYTIMMTVSGITIIPNFYANFPVQTVSQLSPISELTNSFNGLIISTIALPNVRSLKDLAAYGKANPDKLSCGTTGGGTQPHMVCEATANALGISSTSVHYKASAGIMADLRAGRISMFSGGLNRLTENLRMIAILGKKRATTMPDLPTSFEQGYEIDSPNWLGAFAPPKTHPAIVSKLNAELVKAVKAPDVVAALEKLEFTSVGSTVEEFRKKMVDEMVRWQKVVKENKITLD
jgi:tripartite-type tricarboxylate transporter receptor subunit TctC